MGRTQRPYDFPRSRGEVVSRMERLGARSKTAYRESGTNRFNPIPITGKGREIRFSPAISRCSVVVSSIWLQLIWTAVASTVKTQDLVKLNNNSIPTFKNYFAGAAGNNPKIGTKNQTIPTLPSKNNRAQNDPRPREEKKPLRFAQIPTHIDPSYV